MRKDGLEDVDYSHFPVFSPSRRSSTRPQFQFLLYIYVYIYICVCIYTRRSPWIPRNAERYRVNRLFSVRGWPVPGVECRLVRRNTIPWTFLAYIAAHYMIESKRTTGTDGATGNNGSRRGTQSRRPRRFHQVYASPLVVLFVDGTHFRFPANLSFFLSLF